MKNITINTTKQKVLIAFHPTLLGNSQASLALNNVLTKYRLDINTALTMIADQLRGLETSCYSKMYHAFFRNHKYNVNDFNEKAFKVFLDDNPNHIIVTTYPNLVELEIYIKYKKQADIRVFHPQDSTDKQYAFIRVEEYSGNSFIVNKSMLPPNSKKIHLYTHHIASDGTATLTQQSVKI